MQRHVLRIFFAVAILCGIKETFSLGLRADRQCISNRAQSFHGRTDWAKAVAKRNLDAGDWKCNLFVAEVLEACNLQVPNRWWWFSPIGANEWANPRSTYMGSCWRLCSSSNTQEGDVLAIAGYRGSGHVGIVTERNSMTTSATEFRVEQSNWGFRYDQSPTCWRYNC